MRETSAPMSYITRGQRGVTALVLAALLALLVTPLVGADTLLNNVTNTADTFEIIDTDPETGLGSATIAYWLVTRDATDPVGGCNATGNSPASLSFASLPEGVATDATAYQMIGCGDGNAVWVTFTAAAGTFAIPMASVTGGKTGSTYDATQTAFILEVAEEACGDGVDNDGDGLIDEDCNTAPAVTVSGVAEGGAYEYDDVPAAGCDVVDAEDGSFPLDAVLSAISGDYAAYGLGSQTASCEYTDASNEYASATATYSIVDTTAPALTLPSNKTVEATSSSGAAVTFTASAEDALFGAVDILCDAASGDVFLIGTTTVSCSATDLLGNLATGSFTVTVGDSTGPVLDLPADKTVEATSGSGAAVTFSASAEDAVDGTVDILCDAASGDVFPLGSTTVSCSATDSRDNTTSGSFTITVRDTTGPVLDLPDDITAEAIGPSGAAVSFAATAEDAVNGEVDVVCSANSGATFALGTTTVSCSATDSRGNETTGSFTITVEDTTAPEVTVPANKTVAAVNAAGAAVSFASEVSAEDAVDGTGLTVRCAPASGSTFAIGTTTVTCVAEDAAGNEGRNSFTITVSDQTAPELTLPANITTEATAANGALVTYTASATDNVDETVEVSCRPISGVTFALGTTTVACEATDAAGNRATGSFTVTVEDTTAPVIASHGNETAEATSANGALVTYTAPTATDAVDGTLTANCAPASGSTFVLGTTTVTCNVSDAAGNAATATTFSVTVRDTTAPVIASHGNETAEATGPNGALVSYSAPNATDAVDGTFAASCLPASGAQFGLGTTTVTCSATDAAGNAATATTFTVTVTDTTAPAVTVPANQTVEATGPGGAIVTYTASGNDLVDGAIAASCLPASGTTFPIGTTSVACSATDAAGNTGTGSFTVTVRDTTAPVVATLANITVDPTSVSGAVVSYSAPNATDAVSGTFAASCAPVSGSTFAIGTTTVTCSATDGAGNTGTSSFTVTVRNLKLTGFYAPVDMGGVLNTVKAGSTVPLKFEVFAGSTELTDTAVVKSLTYKEVVTSATMTDDIEILATGGTSLRYDSTAGQFVYNWSTKGLVAGKTYQVTVTLTDGSTISALFKMK